MATWRRGHKIGHGSSATVYLATNSDSEEVFAVKSYELSNSQSAKREERILSSLDSPFVISYLGSDISRDPSSNQLSYNLFMEYASGGSLSDKIKRCANKVDEVAIQSHTLEILLGLSYLHEKGIVHCDIKGQNVLIGSNDRAKISDFGCSRYDSNQDEFFRICGTPMYMAPEVARGEEQGKPADIWALGCTVIEMTTGGLPWQGFSDPVSLLHHIGNSSEVPSFPNWVSEKGKDFLSNCLNRDPKERWSVEKLLEHPFVASMEDLVLEKDEIDHSSWVSPKSILDQGHWETSTSDARTEVLERIGMLVIGGESSSPDWTLDENNWISVREDGNYALITSARSTGEDDLVSNGDDYGFDFVYDNDLLEGGYCDNERNCMYLCYCSKLKCKSNKFRWRSFCFCWHNSLNFGVLFVINKYTFSCFSPTMVRWPKIYLVDN